MFFTIKRYGDFGDREVAGAESETKMDAVLRQKEVGHLPKSSQQAEVQSEWPLWEVLIQSKQGLPHKHAGSRKVYVTYIHLKPKK